MNVPLSKSAVSAAVGFALTGAVVTSEAATFAIKSMSITAGTFFMGGVTASPVPFGTGAGWTGPGIGANTDLVGGYINGGIASPVQDPGSIVGFGFFGAPVNTYTASADNVAGTIPGGPVPTGTLDDVAGTISMDLSSFFASWNGTEFNQGNANAGAAGGFQGNWCSACLHYTMSWTSLIVGGPFNGFTGQWVIEGTATPVPVPAAAWLFGSGVVGLVGVARRRRKAA